MQEAEYFKFAHRLEIQASGSLERGSWSRSLLLFKKFVAYHNWFALPERPVSDARAPFVLPEYLKMALSTSVMRNVARFRIRGHGLKCEIGLYGRSADRSARVCNCVKTGIFKMRNTSFFLYGYNDTWCLQIHVRSFWLIYLLGPIGWQSYQAGGLRNPN